MIRILLATILFSPSIWALSCFEYSSGLSASVIRDGDQIRFRFEAGRGYDSIPQVEGPLGVYQMRLAKYQIEALKEIGSGLQISVPASACDLKRVSEGIFSCSAVGKIPGTKLSFTMFNAFRVKQSHTSGDFETQNFRLMVSAEDTFYFLMPFPAKVCSGTL